MSGGAVQRYAFNRTRSAYLAKEVRVADSHWSRLIGLMATKPEHFHGGQGLWIVPCRGVHTMGMRFPIDVVYLDEQQAVVHVEEGLSPWRLAPVKMAAKSVLELPAQTLRSTGTAVGDRIEIALTPAEMTTA
jgi:uncharacterized membrane protein (UPF0127 family)